MTRIHLRKKNRGFTLIELLIVVAIIGIIASILIPNLLDALQKAKQKRTLSEMRNIGTAWMAWLTDQVSASAAGQVIYDASDLATIEHSTLLNHLQPTATMFYASTVPELDGWKHEYVYCRNPTLSAASVLMICSPGRNGLFGDNPDGHADCCAHQWTVGAFTATNYDQDIVWGDGYLVRSPVSTIVGGAAP